MNFLQISSLALLAGGGIVGGSYGLTQLFNAGEGNKNTQIDEEKIKSLINKSEAFTEEDLEQIASNWSKIIPHITPEFLKKFNNPDDYKNFYVLNFGKWKLESSGSDTVSFYLPLIKKTNLIPPAIPDWKRIQINTGQQESTNKIQIQYFSHKGKILDANTEINENFINDCANWMEEANCSSAALTTDQKNLIWKVYSLYKGVLDKLNKSNITQPTQQLTDNSWAVKLDPDE